MPIDKNIITNEFKNVVDTPEDLNNVIDYQNISSDDIEVMNTIAENDFNKESIDNENFRMRHPNRKTLIEDENINQKLNRKSKNRNNGLATSDSQPIVIAEQLPGILTKDIFSELANYTSDCTVSIFIPTPNNYVEGNEQFDRVSFKSIMNTVEQKLLEKRCSKEKIQNLLKPSEILLTNEDFWQSQSEGLSIFIADGFFKYIKMPVSPEKQIVIESTFFVTPLIPIITSNEYFYLLVISKQNVKLFRADSFSMHSVPIEVPQGMEDVKKTTGAEATTGSGQSNINGGGNSIGKDNLAAYFEAVDDILWEKIFNKENVPLVLAGVEYEIPIYKSICDYHNVWEKALTGSREHQTISVLYSDAKELMKPYFEQKQNKALEIYGNKSATSLTSSLPEDVIPAAYYGRIAQLFVCKTAEIWGIFDEMSNELHIHDKQADNSEHLIDNAVVKTLATGGEVFLLDNEQMPMGAKIAAIMRY